MKWEGYNMNRIPINKDSINTIFQIRSYKDSKAINFSLSKLEIKPHVFKFEPLFQHTVSRL